MNNLPLVSVIVPVYGIEQYIGLCIESLLNQTNENLEIILVDDGSTDRAPKICDLYAEKDKRISVIHKQNGGLVSARKAGLAASHGEYIANVDGDDWVDSDFISSLMEEMLRHNADVVIAGHKRKFFEQTLEMFNSVPVGVYENDDLKKVFGVMMSTPDFYGHGIFTYVWNKIFKRDVLFDAQMKVDDRISIGEDAACVYPALLSSKKIVITDNTSYNYRQRENSMLKKSKPFCNEAQSIKILYDYMITNITDTEMRRQIDDYVLSIFVIRSGALLPCCVNGGASLFDIDFRGKRVVIYSAGTFGQQMKQRLEEAGCCEVVGWIDDDYWECRRCCLNVDPINAVLNMDFDYLLVASVNAETGARAKTEMTALGVPADKISLLNLQSPEAKSVALSKYLSFAENSTNK